MFAFWVGEFIGYVRTEGQPKEKIAFSNLSRYTWSRPNPDPKPIKKWRSKSLPTLNKDEDKR